MKLIWKFNIVLGAIFLFAFAVAAFLTHAVLQANAKDEVLRTARLMMEAASATRDYTNVQIKPLLETQLKYTFLPQSVPAFAATEQFNELRKKHADFGYKEAVLNPTNPRDRATDWEADVINQFRLTPKTAEASGERDTPTGRTMFLARPIQITNQACLECHSTVDVAPKTMLDVYGNANGFGWQMNEIIGAQIVSVAMTVPVERANHALRTFLLSSLQNFMMDQQGRARAQKRGGGQQLVSLDQRGAEAEAALSASFHLDDVRSFDVTATVRVARELHAKAPR